MSEGLTADTRHTASASVEGIKAGIAKMDPTVKWLLDRSVVGGILLFILMTYYSDQKQASQRWTETEKARYEDMKAMTTVISQNSAMLQRLEAILIRTVTHN